MTISDFSVHNVLRTYNKQFKIGKLVRGRKSVSSAPKSDAVEISLESKKAAFIGAIATEIAKELGGSASKETVERKVSENFDKFVEELAAEFAPDSEEFVVKLQERLMGLF